MNDGMLADTAETELRRSPAQPPRVLPELVREKSHRSIPSLDGLRAVSVVMVVLSHFFAFSSLPKTGLLHAVLTLVSLGGLGVSTFFVISGFLITTLLLQEQERTGTVAMKRFYFRRALRIFPPYYAYLALAGVATLARHRPLPWTVWLAAAAYVMNYLPLAWLPPSPSAWLVAHTWSLAVEEQFYLFWPVLVLFWSRRRAAQWCIAAIAVVPLLRLLTLLLVPVYRDAEQWSRVFHGSADLLAYGCLLALLMRRPGFSAWVQRLFHPLLLGAAVVVLPLTAVLRSHTPAWFDAVVLFSLTGISVSLLLLWVILRPQTLVGRVLNWAPVRHVGLISYSLYLWQQFFTGPEWMPSRAVNLLWIVGAAELSYWLVERPSLRLRAVLERRWFRPA